MDDLSLFLTEVSGQKYTFSRPMKGEKLLFCIIDGNRIPFASIIASITILHRSIFCKDIIFSQRRTICRKSAVLHIIQLFYISDSGYLAYPE